VSTTLRILKAGPGASVQDNGRRGFLRFGVTPAGPMDSGAFIAASLAAGNAEGAAIEASLGGLELAAEGGEIGLAIAGGAFEIRLDGLVLPPACVFKLVPGARLSVRAGAAGAWVYIAPFGRFDLPLILGSYATHARSGLGGLEGRMLRAGDALEIVDPRPAPLEQIAIAAPWLGERPTKLRVVLGPQQDYFSPESIETFLSARWRLSEWSDRMAYRLEGPILQHLKGHDIVSDGVAFGAIQTPGDGAPLVLMADRQPTGGYPKIANVIGADHSTLAQARPGDLLEFASVSWEEAVAARRARARSIAAGVTLEPMLRKEFSPEFLLERNLVGGVVDGRETWTSVGK
jgi:5-oxoprolinase (ATP-hydrolysing) subunit C